MELDSRATFLPAGVRNNLLEKPAPIVTTRT
jgi:hypothetical protein